MTLPMYRLSNRGLRLDRAGPARAGLATRLALHAVAAEIDSDRNVANQQPDRSCNALHFNRRFLARAPPTSQARPRQVCETEFSLDRQAHS